MEGILILLSFVKSKFSIRLSLYIPWEIAKLVFSNDICIEFDL